MILRMRCFAGPAGPGYNGEDVDNFLQQIRVSYEALIKNNLEQKEKIAMPFFQENASLKKENTTLSSQIQQYREEEDEIKHALSAPKSWEMLPFVKRGIRLKLF